MKLDTDQRDVLIEVRDRMYNDPYASGYICANILEVLLKRDGLPMDAATSMMTKESLKLLTTLCSAINVGINRRFTFRGWLNSVIGNDAGWTMEVAANFTYLGRRAWLDRILETGEIK